MAQKQKISVRLYSALTSAAAGYLLPFVLLSVWLICLLAQDKIKPADNYYMIHYLYTYDHGFISRGLVGEVIGWFAKTVTPEIMLGVNTSFSFLLIAAASLCIGDVLKKTKDKPFQQKTVLFIVLLLCLLPISFRSYYLDVKLDKLVWAVALFAAFCAEKRRWFWLAVPLCVLATLINPVFLFGSMILVAIILLQKCYESGFSKKNVAVCAAAYLLMIAVGLFSTLSEKQVGFANGIEMTNYYFARSSVKLTEWETEWFAKECLFDFFEPADTMIATAYRIYGIEWGQMRNSILNFIFVALPLYVVLTAFWVKAMRSADKKFQKFVFFLCAVSPVILIPPIVLSWEASKYFGNNIMMQLCLIVFFVVSGNNAVMSAAKSALNFCKKNWPLAGAAVVYFSFFMLPLFEA